jgi:excisionase family DNA binding protein
MGQKPLTVREAARALNLSEATIRAWLLHRKIGFVRLGRAIRIPEDEIRRLLDIGTVPARVR